MSGLRWRVRDRGGATVGYVDVCPGITPGAAELLVALPAFDLSPGDVIVQSCGLERVAAGAAVCFDTKEALYALREAFGGREWVRQTWPRWSAPLPHPERADGGSVAGWPPHVQDPRVHLGGFLYDARRWGKVRGLEAVIFRASPPAPSDPEAIDASTVRHSSGVQGRTRTSRSPPLPSVVTRTIHSAATTSYGRPVSSGSSINVLSD